MAPDWKQLAAYILYNWYNNISNNSKQILLLIICKKKYDNLSIYLAARC